jgi:hypothetical protein
MPLRPCLLQLALVLPVFAFQRGNARLQRSQLFEKALGIKGVGFCMAGQKGQRRHSSDEKTSDHDLHPPVAFYFSSHVGGTAQALTGLSKDFQHSLGRQRRPK